VKICNQPAQKVKKLWFLRQDPGWSYLILASGQVYPRKGPKKHKRAKRKFWGQEVLFGTKFLIFDQVVHRYVFIVV